MVTTISNTFIALICAGLILSGSPSWAQGRSAQKKPVEKLSQIKNKFGLGVAIWGETIELLSSDGRQVDIMVEYSGALLGYELINQWERVGLSFGVNGLFLQGQAQSVGNSIVFKESVKMITPIIADVGLHFRPYNNVYAGLSVGAMYSSLKLSTPTSVVANFSFKYAKPIQPLARLKLAWYLSERTLLEQTLFMTQNSSANNGWTVSLGYIY